MAASGHTGLYHVYGEADSLLYIGISKHFGIRWQQHAQKQPWWNERRRMTVDFYDTRDEALDAEALAIFTEQPKYNVMHRKQAQRLKKLQGQKAGGTSRTRAAEAAAAAAGTWDLGRRPLEDLAYLDSLEYLEFIRGLEESARAKELRRLNGTWTEQERKDYEYMRSLNSGLGNDDPPPSVALWATTRSVRT